MPEDVLILEVWVALNNLTHLHGKKNENRSCEGEKNNSKVPKMPFKIYIFIFM